MPKRESVVQDDGNAEAGRNGAKMFRNNVGGAYTQDGTWITFGLHKGSSDTIGWTPVVITQEMVGKTVAVFTSIEYKREKGGRKAEDQKTWIDCLRRDGAIAFFANSGQAVRDAFTEWKRRFENEDNDQKYRRIKKD